MAADPLTAATVDGLFNFDSTDDEDPLNDKTTLSPRPVKRKAGDENALGADLGLDEEVKITKKRKPIAKLDEARLLSAQGIPKLRALALSGKFSKKLHLKGKGHEFSDVARLLNYYQLWLDNLYPRAKFADGLQLIEKVGHSKHMQVMRKEWIDQGKPGYIKDKGRQSREEREIDDMYGDSNDKAVDKHNSGAIEGEGDDSLFIPDPYASNNLADIGDEMPEDDDLDALLAEQETASGTAQRPPPRLQAAATVDIDSEGEDDLDALLAEQETRRAPTTVNPISSKSVSGPTPSPFDEDDDDQEMDDLDALLAEQEAHAMPNANTSHYRRGTQPTAAAPTTMAVASKTVTTSDKREMEDLLNDKPEAEDVLDEDEDDLDALLADQEAHQAATPRPQSSTLSKPEVPLELVGNRDDDDEGPPEVEADGDDMFSSSPVRNTANLTEAVTELELDGDKQQGTVQQEISGSVDASTSDLPQLRAPSPPTQQQQQEQEDHESSEDARAEEVGIGAKQDLEDLEADDMFSSSPVQHE